MTIGEEKFTPPDAAQFTVAQAETGEFNFEAEMQAVRTGSDEGAKGAYRRIARKYHPDINPDPNTQRLFIEANEAYSSRGSEPARTQSQRPAATASYPSLNDILSDRLDVMLKKMSPHAAASAIAEGVRNYQEQKSTEERLREKYQALAEADLTRISEITEDYSLGSIKISNITRGWSKQEEVQLTGLEAMTGKTRYMRDGLLIDKDKRRGQEYLAKEYSSYERIFVRDGLAIGWNGKEEVFLGTMDQFGKVAKAGLASIGRYDLVVFDAELQKPVGIKNSILTGKLEVEVIKTK